MCAATDAECIRCNQKEPARVAARAKNGPRRREPFPIVARLER
jgi:hypothetical protein